MSQKRNTTTRVVPEESDVCDTSDSNDCTTSEMMIENLAENQTYSCASLMPDEYCSFGIRDISRDILVPNYFNIDSLREGFDSIRLIERTQKDTITCGQFQETVSSGSDIDGTAVQCRGPCIDVNKVYKKDEDGDTLLHIAIIILAQDLAFYFIDRTPWYSWLDMRNNLSQTPLLVAVLTNQVALVRRLIVAGADVEARDKDGNMAIHLACRNNLLNIVRTLLEPVRYEEQKQNNYDIPIQTIPQNLNSKNYEGYTCLHIASSLDHIDIVKILIGSGADVNIKAEKSGRTILHEAAWNGNLNLVKYLISLNTLCDISSKTYDGNTAFDLARSRGHWSIVVELATAGAKYSEEELEQ